MNELVTIVVPTHNRHRYLPRVLEYYRDFDCAVIIADSTSEAYPLRQGIAATIQYMHLPGMGLTEKIGCALGAVNTPYLAMSADDDFLIREGLSACLEFLEQDRAYTAAQGQIICYRCAGGEEDDVEFRRLYDVPAAGGLRADEPFERLEAMFSSYKSFFYAVHRTDSLRSAFSGAGQVVHNLYLNEYLTAMVPLTLGKFMELPVLYQIREYSETSDDKTTDNLDRLFSDEAHKNDLDAYVEFLATRISAIAGKDKPTVAARVMGFLQRFAGQLATSSRTRISFKKRIGRIVVGIPGIGPMLIRKSRKQAIASDMKKVIRTDADRRTLASMTSIIKKYGHGIRHGA